MKKNIQIEALQESIKHYEENYQCENVEDIHLGWTDCACCVLWIEKACDGCPIEEFTGESLCYGTPYQDYRFDEFCRSTTTREIQKLWVKDNREHFLEEISFLQKVLNWVEAGKPK